MYLMYVLICTQYAAFSLHLSYEVTKMHHLPTIYEDRIWTVDPRSSPPSASSMNRHRRRKYERRALKHRERTEIEYYERIGRYLFILNGVSTVILLAGMLFALHR
jgi:hypothetical protein